MNEKKAKILFIDIENTPLISYNWGRFEQNAIAVQQESYILSIAYKWQGDKNVKVLTLNQFKGYKPNVPDDKQLMIEIHKLFSQADIIIGQNGDAFDVKKINTRFIANGLKAVAPYKTVDTLKVAKKHFAFSSNSLNELGKFLGLGEKRETHGFKTWLGCMQGDKKSWNIIRKYNAMDIILLEKVYLRLLPFMKGHPNLGMYHEDIVCPKCESSNFQYRGYAINATTKYKRAQCQECAGWFRVGKNLKVIKPGVSA